MKVLGQGAAAHKRMWGRKAGWDTGRYAWRWGEAMTGKWVAHTVQGRAEVEKTRNWKTRSEAAFRTVCGQEPSNVTDSGPKD